MIDNQVVKFIGYDLWMSVTLAFDVYGTLIDPLGITVALGDAVGSDAPAFAAAWRRKQVEYFFRRGLGRKYASFSVCTRQALDYTCAATGHDLSSITRDALMAAYQKLPAFPEVGCALAALKGAGYRCFAFSNGEPAALAALLRSTALDTVLDGVVSVVDVRSYKPDPAVYAFFVENTGAELGRTWLVSGNPFDVIGALEVGWKAAWVQRSEDMLFDPWDVEPSAVVANLGELLGALGSVEA
jgi:2-haloacid dehalogenase